MKKLIHVAVGVIFSDSANLERQILIAKRADHQHQGGLWEFPGGKVEEGESVQTALQRELMEEVGLVCDIENMKPLLTIPFHYHDKSVLLDVWEVYASQFQTDQFQADQVQMGQSVDNEELLIGKEGQPLIWVDQQDLANYEFPAANKAIIDALLLPNQIAISQDDIEPEVILAQVAKTLQKHSGIWIQLRAPSLDQLQYTQLAMQLYGICREAGSKLIWNCPFEWYQVAFADGLHLSVKNSEIGGGRNNGRPIPSNQWFSLACHNLDELELAQDLADYVLVSPVKETATHPEAKALAWAGFKIITEQARIPCYALGGLDVLDISEVQQQGGQGIAGIRCFIPG
jgi:8-oxo-dGTP diphosphatase